MRFLAVLLIALLTIGATFNATYDVQEDDVEVTYGFETEKSISLRLPSDVQEVTLDGAATETPVMITEGVHTLSFRTQAVTERSQNTHLLADLSPIPAGIGTVRVLLPLEARLVQGLAETQPSIHPRPTVATTDGTRLIFEWNGPDLEPARAVLVTYETPNDDAWMFALAFALLAAALAIAIVARKINRSSTNLTRNLYEDEKHIVETLKKNGGELWQKELQEKSGLSKVKVSRKIRSLQAKGVVEKIPYGNTNKVRIK